MNLKLISLIQRIWRNNPDLRLGQLLTNPFPPTDMYYIEDKELEDRLREYYEIEEKNEKIDIPEWGWYD